MVIYKLEDQKQKNKAACDFVEFMPTNDPGQVLLFAQQHDKGDRVCIQVRLSDLESIVKSLKTHDTEKD